MFLTFFFILLVLQSLNAKANRIKRKEESCQLMDICEETPYGYVPCVIPGSPQTLKTEKAKSILRDECPHLFEKSDNPRVCCTDQEVISIQKVLVYDDYIVKSCPACLKNINRMICHVVCTPYHTKEAKVAKTIVTKDGRTAATAIDFYLDNEYAKKVYESCRNIKVHGTPFEKVICPDGKCDHTALLAYIGNDIGNGGHASIQASFIVKNQSFTENGRTFFPISIPVEGCKESCKCEDCPAAC